MVKFFRAAVAAAALLIGWVCALGAAKIYHGLYGYPADWRTFLIISIVFSTLGLRLIRPFLRITSIQDLVDRPLLMPALIALCGSLAIAVVPSIASIPVAIGLVVYSIIAPLRLAARPRWGRTGAWLTLGWLVCLIVVSGVASEFKVDPDQSGVMILPVAAFLAMMVLSSLMRVLRGAGRP